MQTLILMSNLMHSGSFARYKFVTYLPTNLLIIINDTARFTNNICRVIVQTLSSVSISIFLCFLFSFSLFISYARLRAVVNGKSDVMHSHVFICLWNLDLSFASCTSSTSAMHDITQL